MRIALSLSLSLAVTACASSPGRLETNRFQHELYPFSLFYGDGANAEHPLGADYTLENYEVREGPKFYAKLGPDFTIERAYRDQQPAVLGREPFYDLSLKRAQPQAQVWLRSVPLSPADAEQPLGVLAQRYVSAAQKSARPTPPFGVEAAPQVDAGAAAKDVHWRACELSKREAVRLDFALANPAAADKLNEPESFQTSVVLVRSGYFSHTRYPVLIVAGKSSPLANDAKLDADFDRMLELLVLGDKYKGLSMKGGHTCGKQAPATTAEAGAGTAPGASSGDLRAPTLEVPIIQEDPQ